jgi:RNA recognition motif-containing protein
MQARLFIGNLGWNVTETDLAQVVSAYSTVLDTKIITDRDTGRSRGFGFVTIEAPNVQDVIRALDGQVIDGRAIRVSEAEAKPQHERGRFGSGSSRRNY